MRTEQNPFVPGDVVRCVDAEKAAKFLVFGTHYTVATVAPRLVTLVGQLSTQPFFSARFVLAYTPESPAPPVHWREGQLLVCVDNEGTGLGGRPPLELGMVYRFLRYNTEGDMALVASGDTIYNHAFLLSRFRPLWDIVLP